MENLFRGLFDTGGADYLSYGTGTQVFTNPELSSITQGAEQNSGNPTEGLQYHITATDGTLPGSVGDVVVADAAFAAVGLDASNKVKEVLPDYFTKINPLGSFDEDNYIAVSSGGAELSDITDTPDGLRILNTDVTVGALAVLASGFTLGDQYLVQAEFEPGYTITGDGVILLVNGELTIYATLTAGATATKLSALVTIASAGIIGLITTTAVGAGSVDVYIKSIRAWKVV